MNGQHTLATLFVATLLLGIVIGVAVTQAVSLRLAMQADCAPRNGGS